LGCADVSWKSAIDVPPIRQLRDYEGSFLTIRRARRLATREIGG
jgi:hypothetical protein